ncbi:MAG: hypothetical protein MUP58_01850 [Candidatus Nanohaloarchaeota archaeon QJJ-9]|nr:hypothetical protein [Candidatus Nanohaloarchaeota archaeon QJJ-9]
MKRKAQFFMIGMIILSSLILGFIGIRSGISFSSTTDKQTQRIFDHNLERFPEAVSSAIREEKSSKNLEKDLKTYIEFQNYVEKTHGIQSQSFFLIGIPTAGGYNLTVGNYRGEKLENLTVELGEESINHSISDERIESYSINCTESFFEVSVSFEGGEYQFNSTKKVFSLYNLRYNTIEGVWTDTIVN